MAIKILFFLILIKVYLDSANFIIAFLFLSRFDTLPLLQAKSYKDYALKVTEYRNLKYRQYTTRSLSKKLQI